MLKTVTLDTFRDAIAAEQKPFLGIPTLPTFFGILALTTVVIDTYLNAIGKNGFTVFSINSIFGSIHYLALFSFVIISQLIFISIAFLNLRHLRFIPWKSPIIYANYLLNNQRVYLAFFITLAILISWGLSHAISVSSNLETVTGVSSGLLAIIFTFVVYTAITIIVSSIIKILRFYPSLSVGLIFGIFICTVSYILTPNQPQVIVDLQKVRDQVISEQTATTTIDLKVRENPGSQSPELGIILKGDLVVLLGKEEKSFDGGNWTLISNNNIKGWVNKKYLSINPPSTKVLQLTDKSSELVHLSEINQFKYWQAGIFFVTITSFTLFFLLIKFSQTTEETIFQLDLDKDQTGTSFYEHSPSGLELTTPIYVKILAQNQLIIAFSRGINSNSYNLLDIRNNQSIIPLHDSSIIIWNISKIKEKINESFSTVDTLNSFSFTGSIGFLTTTISYHDQSRNFNQSTIDFISEIFFKNSNDLKNIIKGAFYSTFEEYISPLRMGINEISSEVDTFNLFEVNVEDTKYQSGGYKNYKQEELKDIQLKAQSIKDKINTNIKSLKDIRNKTGGHVADLANRIVDKIIINISDRIAQIGLSGNFINETKHVFQMLGFRISEANLKILDINCENKLRELQQKIEDRLKEIKKEYDAARIKEEEVDIELYKHYFEMIVRILENPSLGREEKLNIIKAMPYRRAMEIYRNLTHDDPSIISKPQPKTLIQIENDDNTEGPT